VARGLHEASKEFRISLVFKTSQTAWLLSHTVI
jgi:hypothetical protein